jgi:Secretion system C-terminal sorting domain
MKKNILLFLFSISTCIAQKELWGTTRQTPYPTDEQGNIVKFDMNGENAVTVHHFNYTTGKLPSSKLFLASNGKLYGTATYGGIGSTTPTYEQDGYGVLYEYDLTFDTYRVLHYYNATLGLVNPSSGLMEPILGKLYGGTTSGSFYVYDIASETVTSLNHTYSFVAMGGIYSDLIKASNGFVYAISNNSFPCTSPGPNQPNEGSLIKINTATNTAQRVAVFGCSSTTTISASGGFSMVEVLPNKIFFGTSSYAPIPSEGLSYPVGGIIEYNTVTNDLTQKLTFDPLNSLGFSLTSIVRGNNGNLYGVCANGGDTYRSPYTSGIFNKTGTLFEYNPAANTIVKLTEFLTFKNLPSNIIKLSTGNLMGNLGYGSLFKYTINTNTLQFPDLITYSDPGNQFSTQNLIEICRKPSYRFFDVATFDGCVGGAFTYDIQNTNATSYQWQKNNINVAGQTTGILNLTNLTTSDAGNYTCLMTNECGTTTTMVLQLTVSCLGTNTVATLEKSITLYPNPAKNILNLKLPENIDVNVNSVTIVNSLGQIVLKQKTENTTTIDVSNLQKGMYFVSLASNYGNWNGKFVKE